jgi:hypothetical protein
MSLISSQKTAPESYLLADCVSVTVKDQKVCLELPLDLGEKCVEVPDWVPNGEAARACISVKKISSRDHESTAILVVLTNYSSSTSAS